MGKIAVVVLAAGKGTRMRSRLPKVLHKIAGKYMVRHVLDACRMLAAAKIILVVGYRGEEVQQSLGPAYEYAWQREQLGTGHAVLQAAKLLTPDYDTVLVVCGDTPLLTAETLTKMLEMHRQEQAAATILTASLPNPAGYGRIIRDKTGAVVKIVEQKDANPAELLVKEINAGTYCFNAGYLQDALLKLAPDNAQGEYYLTDVVELLTEQQLKVVAYETATVAEIMGVNSRVQLAWAETELRMRINTNLMESGVTIIDPANTYIESDVQIAEDTLIYPYTFLRGDTVIGEGCEIGPNCTIENSTLAAGCTVKYSIILDSKLGENCQVGPFSYLRPGNNLGRDVKVGDFVELKKTSVGIGSKIPHLSYVGDAEIGNKVNIGAGTITCNYDGVAKWPTVIEDNAFIGSNSNLVAPVKVEQGAYVAAGSTITKDIPGGSLGVARGRQVNIPGWAQKKQQAQEEN